MDLQLGKKIALVSGSTAGIGNAIAASLAREGATVIVNGRTPAAVDGAVAAMKSATGGDVIGFAGDLSVASVAEKLAGVASPLSAATNGAALRVDGGVVKSAF
jgi:NAD(P)-dependent dehydrogenase (short-subunit alcohol dehydrogenase family)